MPTINITEYSQDTATSLQQYSNSDSKQAAGELLRIIEEIAATGATCYEWSLLTPVLAAKLDEILAKFLQDDKTTKETTESLAVRKGIIVDLLKSHKNPPFTIQRFCELLARPTTYYTKLDKFLNAAEKLCRVHITIAMLEPEAYNAVVKEVNNKNKMVVETDETEANSEATTNSNNENNEHKNNDNNNSGSGEGVIAMDTGDDM